MGCHADSRSVTFGHVRCANMRLIVRICISQRIVIDNMYEVSVDESNLVAEDTDAATAIKDWFSKVQEAPDAAA